MMRALVIGTAVYVAILVVAGVATTIVAYATGEMG
ncbi:MAG: hypothetical protein JWN27_2911 [Candidatus Eremiobacteraeota bacterium]|nr:hypothetical protein [Candidatus Eremiobacteraeota bacterium]